MRLVMPADKQRRTNRRMTRHHNAWIKFQGNTQSHKCRVVNISTAGARLTTNYIDAPIGGAICLLNAKNANSQISGRIVWRNGREIGVEFV
jgi:hypothetical protein